MARDAQGADGGQDFTATANRHRFSRTGHRGGVTAALHEQIRAIADEHGVTTDIVMPAIGILERDVSVVADPRLKERLQLLGAVGDEPQHEAASM